jgi:hypothetical protein
MSRTRTLVLLAATLCLSTCAARPATPTDPPSDLCTLLPVADINKSLGQTFTGPDKAVAPRPFPNSVEGTDCNDSAGNSKLWFRAYADPDAATATDLFAKLAAFFGEKTTVSGVGDEAYFDPGHSLHVRKGRFRYFLNLEPIDDPSKSDKRLKDLATKVAARLSVNGSRPQP